MQFILAKNNKFMFYAIFKPLPLCQQLNHTHIRAFMDSTIKCVRDRGLDHAVEREKYLKPVINIKNFMKCEPSKSLPISVISENRESLKIPIRPIDFIRKFPSVFEEFLPGGIGIHPHIRLTPQVLNLDAEEQLIYQSDNYKQQIADRLLKLLMISRLNKIPLTIIDYLKWDLGLPQDYLKTVIPKFPDYFQVVGCKDSVPGSKDMCALELVCWSNEMATSVLVKKVAKGELGNTNGMPIAFPIQFSNGFKMDKKHKKWLDDWQKLPYISPYENAAHLSPKSDESDKWTVAVMHEILHTLVPKKTERENLLLLGQHLGLRSRFKKALLCHPGIFYISSKIGTHTVVLREGYKRGVIIENHPLMNMRNQYVHLMNTMKEDGKAVNMSIKSPPQERVNKYSNGNKEKDDDGSEADCTEKQEFCDSADAENATYCDCEDGNDKVPRSSCKTAAVSKYRTLRKLNSDVKGPVKNSRRRGVSVGEHPHKSKEKGPLKISRRDTHGRHKDGESLHKRSKLCRIKGWL